MTSIFRYRWTHPGVEGYLEDYLRKGGGPVTVAEAMAVHGDYWIQRAALNSARRDAFKTPRLRGYPPRVFISYRWESDAAKAWVLHLGFNLRKLGLEVFIDQEHQERIGPEGLGIPEFAARVSKSHIFLIVVTSAFVREEVRNWIVEEHQIADIEGRMGRLEILMIWKEGENLPNWSGNYPLIDMRSDPDDVSVLEERLGYDGLVLSSEEEDELVAMLMQVEELMESGNYARAREILREGEAYCETDEYQQYLAHTVMGLGDLDAAAKLGLDVLEHGKPTVETQIDLAMLLDRAGRKNEALRFMTRCLPLAPLLAGQIHCSVGTLLDDLGDPQAGINHLKCALTLDETSNDVRVFALATLGWIHLHRLSDFNAALEYLEEALELSGEEVLEHVTANRVVALLYLGRLSEAKMHWEEAIAQRPNDDRLQQIGLYVRVGVPPPLE